MFCFWREPCCALVPSSKPQRPTADAVPEILPLSFGEHFYPPTHPSSGVPLSLRDIPLRGDGRETAAPFIGIILPGVPRSVTPEGAVCGLEPLQGARPQAAGEPLWAAGCAAEARPADDTARRSRDSGLLFASGLRPAPQKQGTATRGG